MLARPELTSVQKEILAIADHLEKHGWCQNVLYDDDDKCCIIGAALRAGVLSLDTPFALTIGLGGNIITYNDAPGRTKEEVIQKLREIAYEVNYDLPVLHSGICL